MQTVNEARHARQVMQNSRIRLFNAIEAAEGETQGTAISALPILRGRNLLFEVYTITPDDRLVSVLVGDNGRVRSAGMVSRIDYGSSYMLAGGEERAGRDLQEPGDLPRRQEVREGQPRGEQLFRPIRASKLMDAKVVDHGGKTLGDLDDLAINASRGEIAYAVFTSGGFLNLGEKKYAVPWRIFQIRTDDRLTLDVDKDTLKEMPGFEGNDWPATADASWFERVRGGGRYAEAGYSEAGALPRYDCRGTDLIGKDVHNMQGQDLGKLRELVLDSQRGRIVFGVIGKGGVMGVGDRLIAVPWSAFKTREKDTLRLDIDPSRLETAPTFSGDNWAAVADRDFVNRVCAFYEQPPYGQDAGAPGRPMPRPATPREPADE
ncbi:MAG: PRC-barrel domain-containing protein [Planctomycetota bacterium]